MPRKPVTPAPKAPAPKLELREGVYVRLRNGEELGPIQRQKHNPYPWYATDKDYNRPIWTARGQYYADGTRSGWDIVAIIPPPGAPAPAVYSSGPQPAAPTDPELLDLLRILLAFMESLREKRVAFPAGSGKVIARARALIAQEDAQASQRRAKGGANG